MRIFFFIAIIIEQHFDFVLLRNTIQTICNFPVDLILGIIRVHYDLDSQEKEKKTLITTCPECVLCYNKLLSAKAGENK